jgi:hypothetical protein
MRLLCVILYYIRYERESLMDNSSNTILCSLSQWYSTWDTLTPGVSEDILRGT